MTRRQRSIGVWIAASLLCIAGAGCGDDVKSDSSGQSSSSSSTDGPCSLDAPCSKGVCVFPEGSCAPDTKGVCFEGSYQCGGPPTGPGCLCDGTVVEEDYADCSPTWNEQLHTGPEACAQGTFTCGDLQCKRHVEVCIKTSGGAGPTTSYNCLAVADAPGTCKFGIGACGCLDLNAMGCIDASSCCQVDSDYQETVSLSAP